MMKSKRELSLLNKLILMVILLGITPVVLYSTLTFKEIKKTKVKIVNLKVEDSTETILKNAKKAAKEAYSAFYRDLILFSLINIILVLFFILFLHYKVGIPLKETEALLNKELEKDQTFRATATDELFKIKNGLDHLLNFSANKKNEQKKAEIVLKGLETINEKVSLIAEGNLKVNIEVEDENLTLIAGTLNRLSEKLNKNISSMREILNFSRTTIEAIERMLLNILKITEKEGIELDIFNIEVNNITKSFTHELNQMVLNYRNIRNLEIKLKKIKFSQKPDNEHKITEKLENFSIKTLSKLSNFSELLKKNSEEHSRIISALEGSGQLFKAESLKDSLIRSANIYNELVSECGLLTSDFLKLVDFVNSEKLIEHEDSNLAFDYLTLLKNVQDYIARESDYLKKLFRTSKKNFLLFSETISTLKKLYKKAEEKTLGAAELKMKLGSIKKVTEALSQFCSNFSGDQLALNYEKTEIETGLTEERFQPNILSEDDENSVISMFPEEELREASIKSAGSNFILSDRIPETTNIKILTGVTRKTLPPEEAKKNSSSEEEGSSIIKDVKKH